MTDIIIHKFGGSCLRDSSDLKAISSIINSQNEKSVIVVSAMWGTTDRLIRAANEPRYAARLVSDLRKQHLRFAPSIESSSLATKFNNVLHGIDRSLLNLSKDPNNKVDHNTLLAAGERLSALVVAHELRRYGLNTHPIGSEDIGICLDGVDFAATVDIEKSINCLDYSAFDGIPVITGWFGEGNDGNLALLDRGGSDHSAAAIARILDAKKLVLWKDVNGILSINPRWGVITQPIQYLGYDEARELSRLDAPVIHHTTMIPIKEIGIPIEIRNLHSDFNSKAPTIIGPTIIQSNEIKAIGCLRSISRITAESTDVMNQSKILANILLEFDRVNITCWSIKSNPSTIDIVVSQKQSSVAINIVKRFISIGEINNHSCLISFIGTVNEKLVEQKIKQIGISLNQITYLNSTNVSVQYLFDTEDINWLMQSLSNVVTTLV